MLYLIGVHFHRLPLPLPFVVADDDSRVQDCVLFDQGGEEKLLLVCKQG